MADEIKGKVHQLIITERKGLSVSEVSKVQSFGPKEIVLETTLGNLILKGEELGIRHLDLQAGKIDIEGQVDAAVYTRSSSSGARSALWRRIFR